MRLDFPNRRRCFDEARQAVRFAGQAGLFEVPFLVEAAALFADGKRSATATSEAACLAAFDAAQGSIHDVAREAHCNSRRTSYTLTAADFL